MKYSDIWRLLECAEEARDYLANLDDEDAMDIAERLDMTILPVRAEGDLD